MRHLYLAYSADRQESSQEPELTKCSPVWKQLELFPQSNAETVIFIRPDQRRFDELIRMAQEMSVRHIVDIRDVPYLNFSGFDRERVFELLDKSSIGYRGVHPVIHQDGVESLSSLLDGSTKPESKSYELFASFLKQQITTGPTMVFCERNPREDEKVKGLLDFISKQEYKYSPVLAMEPLWKPEANSACGG